MFGTGYYPSFSFSNFFNYFTPDEITLTLFFIVILVLLSSSLKKLGIFRDHTGAPQKGTIAVLSLALALGATYGIYTRGYVYEIQDFFSTNGISPFWALVAVASVIFIIRFRLSTFLITGGILTLLAVFFTDLFYETTIAAAIGAAILILGFFIRSWARGRQQQYGPFPQGHVPRRSGFPWNTI